MNDDAPIYGAPTVIGSATGPEAGSEYDDDLVIGVSPAEGEAVVGTTEIILVVSPHADPSTGNG